MGTRNTVCNVSSRSLSFICATGAMAFLLLTICYIVIDIKNLWNGGPFYFAGLLNSYFLIFGQSFKF